MDIKYYCVGFSWSGRQDKNQLPRFKKDGIWENGYDDKFLDTVNNVQVGSRLAAKTTYTRKDNGKTISVLQIHALGTVTENPKNGRLLKVDWDKNFTPYTVDGRGAYRSTISQVRLQENIELIFDHKKAAQKGVQDDKQPILSENAPLNIIMYGPPGTGKTYHTINKAVAIADSIPESDLLNFFPNRKDLKEHFDELLIENWDNPSGQIAFVTFHQSTSYEDFVEGIKPLTSDKNEVYYDIIPGVFKRIATLAEDNWLDSRTGNLNELSYEKAFAELKDQWDETPDMKFPMKTQGKEFTITGFSKSSINFKKASGGSNHTLSISTLKDYFYKKREIRQHGLGIYYPGVIEKLKSFQPEIEIEKEEKKYVLIIDEINRGNISQIFGELITLIEEDKRQGKNEHLEVILPYSKEKFSVPPNLYIIGTMNTADRSVEALDTALRRRFYFEEIVPMPELLSPERMLWQFWWEIKDLKWVDEETKIVERPFYELIGFPYLDNIAEKGKYWEPMEKDGVPDERQIELFKPLIGTFTGVNLNLLLKSINGRIEKLLSKDYMIGHAYLINVRSIVDLKSAFFNKILPLLQEYFYGDYGRIGLIIGREFYRDMEKDVVEFIKTGYDIGDLNENKVYHLKKANDFKDDEDFLNAVKGIYE